MLINLFLPEFLMITCLVLLLGIGILNVFSILNYRKTRTLNIIKPTSCNFTPPTTADPKTFNNCVGKDLQNNKGSLFFTLSVNPPNSNYEVCSQLCGGTIDKQGNCSDGNPIQYQECLDLLEPTANCTNIEPMLSYNSINYYPQTILTNPIDYTKCKNL